MSREQPQGRWVGNFYEIACLECDNLFALAERGIVEEPFVCRSCTELAPGVAARIRDGRPARPRPPLPIVLRRLSGHFVCRRAS